MSSGGQRNITLNDCIVLGVSLLSAFAIWLAYNLSSSYSGIIQCNVQAMCRMEGHSDRSVAPARLIARCEMGGYSMLKYTLFGADDVEVLFDCGDMIPLSPTRFCIPSSSLGTYVHNIFPGQTKVEYYVTDTLFFDFPLADCKKLPVNFVCELCCRPQYMETGPVMLQPDSVVLYGPVERLALIECINTRPFVLEDVNSDVLGEALLDVPEGLRAGVQTVDFQIPVSRYVEETVEVPVCVTGVPDGRMVSVFPSRAELRLKLRFPFDQTLLEDLQVNVPFKDFEASRKGKCTGYLSKSAEDIISFEINPEVFDCVSYVDGGGNQRTTEVLQ